jgi:hypothetical protein
MTKEEVEWQDSTGVFMAVSHFCWFSPQQGMVKHGRCDLSPLSRLFFSSDFHLDFELVLGLPYLVLPVFSTVLYIDPHTLIYQSVSDTNAADSPIHISTTYTRAIDVSRSTPKSPRLLVRVS